MTVFLIAVSILICLFLLTLAGLIANALFALRLLNIIQTDVRYYAALEAAGLTDFPESAEIKLGWKFWAQPWLWVMDYIRVFRELQAIARVIPDL